MRVIQAVLGAFHHFELARELEERRHLEKIYSTWPWARLKREGLPRERVGTFPYIHGPHMLLRRYNFRSERLDAELDMLARTTLDSWLARQTRPLPAPDALVLISSSVVAAAEELKARGTAIFCDRSSTHWQHQERVVREECLRWGLPAPLALPRVLERELRDYEIADAITVPSLACKRSFAEYGVPMEKIHIIPFGVRLERFKKVADPPEDRFEVLFVGSLGIRKGIPYLLQAFAELRHPNKRLTVIGGANTQTTALLSRLPTENVRFLGALPQVELIDHMSRSHVMVLPSIEEGLALVQGQAMACGCPVLATTETGSEDLYTDGVEGFIVEPRRVDQLVERLEQLAGDRGLRDRMGAAAIKRVRSLGGWKQYGDQWEALLKSVTGKQ